ncbi:hypothetical protein Clacol_007231 [Clathrus columnatus]|uniref:Vps72/YL1 C-terminal domain-containing protein n=1 Tax=Clathrus columnatus TaxID=1419009 RepID=A0AAV5AJW6_9AGAM|nr:hypothetical protein Clacol_007231 [Clathrus columnatus]
MSGANGLIPVLSLAFNHTNYGVMPPKGKKKVPVTPAEGSVPPHTPTLGESLSYLHSPRPFKNPYYTKNASRRTKGLKYVLAAEREKTKQEREKQKETDIDADMEVDNQYGHEEMPTYTSIEASPSVLPPKRYCDITGLESPDTEKAYLALRGVNPVVK